MNHDLIKTGDSDVFPQILDGNGEVVLSYCRRCRKAEAELTSDCVSNAMSKESIAEALTPSNADEAIAMIGALDLFLRVGAHRPVYSVYKAASTIRKRLTDLGVP